MTTTYYEPIKLNSTNRYAGYQFHARVRVDGIEPADGFKFLILSVYRWLRGRVPEEDRDVPELSLPEAEQYAEAEAGAFLPYHFSVGYSLDITPLMAEGIWALRLKEPDSGSKGREAVPGRIFTTRIGLRLNEKGYTELGIRIDVTDPAGVEKEVDFAFRPGFVRSLAIQPSVVFEMVREQKYGQPEMIETESDYKRFLYMLDHEDNQLPLVVFTFFRPEEKKPAAGMSMEDFVKSDPLKSFLQSSGVGMGSLKMSKKRFDYTMPERSGMPARKVSAVSPLSGIPSDLAGAGLMDKPSAMEPPVMPFDAAAFSRSAFAYALTYVLGDKYTEKLKSRLKKDFWPGDILICGAGKFRGGVSVVNWPGTGEEEIKRAYDAALLLAQSYSKHKAPYDFGSVVFEAEARKMEQHARVMELVNSSTMEDQDKIRRMKYEMELLFDAIDDKDTVIDELKAQKEEAFRRGVDFGGKEKLTLEKEIAGLKKSLAEKQDQIDQMQGSYQQARDVLDVLEQMRRVDALPVSNEDVIRYFRLVYRDRLDFTERGEAEASKCGLRPSSLWSVLYTVANDMVDLFRNVQENLTEEAVMKATGFEVAFQEGSMTRKDSDLMRLREDEYEGRTISVEPHLKLKSSKGEPAHQRLHFCYVPDLKRVVIGYLGDHLDSAATRYAKKR